MKKNHREVVNVQVTVQQDKVDRYHSRGAGNQSYQAHSLVYLNGLGAADEGNDKTVTVEIPSGSGASAIVDILDSEGLVKNSTFAKIHARIGGYDSLQANTYMFNKTMTPSEMMEAINYGGFQVHIKGEVHDNRRRPLSIWRLKPWLMELPFTADELKAKWCDRDYITSLTEKYWFLTDEVLADGIICPLEGYLYPETYFVSEEDPSLESITEMMLDKTGQELSKIKKDIEKTGMTVHEFLTLASIVENESLFEEDRAKIAGVFINRLEKDMPLQSDITVLYPLGERRVEVTYDDLEVDSKYNTYNHQGLPVGPVCAVPARTMDDVINYEKSDYLFFFATEDGKVLYSKTAQEHEKTVEENKWY